MCIIYPIAQALFPMLFLYKRIVKQLWLASCPRIAAMQSQEAARDRTTNLPISRWATATHGLIRLEKGLER